MKTSVKPFVRIISGITVLAFTVGLTGCNSCNAPEGSSFSTDITQETSNASESLKDVSGRLDDRFIKINRSCIINSDKVIEYDPSLNKITLKNGITSYDVSRDNKKTISSLFIKHK